MVSVRRRALSSFGSSRVVGVVRELARPSRRSGAARRETGAGPPGMDETATKERLLWSAVSILRRHPDYWILKTTDPEGRPVAIQSEGWLFLFTSPDVALRHSLDAHESAEGLPAMEPHRFSSKMVRDHAHSAPAG